MMDTFMARLIVLNVVVVAAVLLNVVAPKILKNDKFSVV
jgi:hypothetical protein